MLRIVMAVTLVAPYAAGVAAPLPVAAAVAPADDASQGKCSEKTKRRSSLFGSVLGSAASTITGRSSMLGGLISTNLFAQTLTNAIACKLDKSEQKQAAAATDAVVTRGGVGTTQDWTSDTRENVSGSSTVQSATKLADGTSCMTVKDVIIVNGEETTADKKMCRKPGASGYSVAQV